MQRFRWILVGFLVVVATLGTIASDGVQAATPSGTPDENVDQSSMETIRETVNRPEVKEHLRDRGISEEDVEYRLSLLDSNLNRSQKRTLAQKLTRTESPTSRNDLPGSDGNRFLGTTLDVVTSILLLPIKIVAWFIPGL